MRNHFFVVKFIFGIALFAALLFWQGQPDEFLKIFQNFKWHYLYLLLFLALILNLTSCFKWNLFLKERNIQVSHMRLLGLYLIGRFFNNFMPSMIGGDLTRTYLLGRQINSQSKALASVFLERFTGFLALIGLAFIFAIINVDLIQEPIIALSLGSMAACIFLFLLLMRKPELMAPLFRLFPAVIHFLDRLKFLYNDIAWFRKKHGVLIATILVSLVFHVLTFVNVYVCCLSIGFHPKFIDIALITPIILLLTSIPISPNNIGWWEWCFSIYLVQAGAGRSEGFAVALVLRGVSLIFSGIGGVLFLIEKDYRKELQENKY